MGVFMGEGSPVHLQTISVFEGRGLFTPQPLDLRYVVPAQRTAGMFYFRAGSSVGGLVNVSILRNGEVMRYFPVAPNSAIHVALAIVEELEAGTVIDVVAAGEGSGVLILDIGYLEL